MKTIFMWVLGITILSLVLFFAFIGLIFMMVTHEDSLTDTCDKVVEVNTDFWCMAKMQSEDERIRVLRTENSQETVDWGDNAKQ